MIKQKQLYRRNQRKRRPKQVKKREKKVEVQKEKH
jgi:hypothetical protein